jgi:hypothetical protein
MAAIQALAAQDPLAEAWFASAKSCICYHFLRFQPAKNVRELLPSAQVPGNHE